MEFWRVLSPGLVARVASSVQPQTIWFSRSSLPISYESRSYSTTKPSRVVVCGETSVQTAPYPE